MKIAVRYFSRSGNTKKVADAIAQAVGVSAKDCSQKITEPVDLLFLGGSLYWGGIDKNLKKYISQLDSDKIKCVATFGTSSIKKEADNECQQLVAAKNIAVKKEIFHCFGSFSALQKGHPNSADLEKAAAFASALVNSSLNEN